MPIFVCPKAVTDLKNALYYPLVLLTTEQLQIMATKAAINKNTVKKAHQNSTTQTQDPETIKWELGTMPMRIYVIS